MGRPDPGQADNHAGGCRLIREGRGKGKGLVAGVVAAAAVVSYDGGRRLGAGMVAVVAAAAAAVFVVEEARLPLLDVKPVLNIETIEEQEHPNELEPIICERWSKASTARPGTEEKEEEEEDDDDDEEEEDEEDADDGCGNSWKGEWCA